MSTPHVTILLLSMMILFPLTSAITKSCSIEEGITVTRIGKLALSTSTQRINVLIKINPPNLSFTPRCNSTSQLVDTLNLFKNRSSTLIHDITTPIIQPTRGKRQLLAILGTTLLAALGAGIGAAEVHVHSLKSHLQQTRAETNIVINRLNTMAESNHQFETKTIGILKTLTSVTKQSLHNAECESIFVDKKIELYRYIDHFDRYLNMAAQGNIRFTLSPEIIDYTTLIDIVTKHDSFTDSLFIHNPTYLYGLATVTMANIIIQDSVIHFILEYPAIFNSNIVDLYQTEQIGLHVTRDRCIYFDLPDYYFHMENSTYEIMISPHKCSTHKDLTICATYKHLLKTSCITRDRMSCSYTVTECTSPFQFTYTSAGLLLRDNSRESYLTESTGAIRKISFHNYSTTMVQWQNIDNIFIGQQLLIENPGIEYASLTTVTDYNMTLDFNDFFPIDSGNITDAYKNFFQINKITPLKSLQTIKYNSISITTLITASTLLFIIVVGLAIKSHLKQNKILRKWKHANATRYHYKTLPDFDHSHSPRRAST